MFKKIFLCACAFSLLFFSCESTDVETEVEIVEPEVEVVQEPEEEAVLEEIQEPEVDVEDVEDEIEEIEEIEEIDEVQDIDEEPQDIDEIDEVEDVEPEDEFTRSTNELEETITVEEFTEDKATILQKIQELDAIMENYEFENWKKHISPSSIEYYSNPLNLRKAQKKLPDKRIQLKGLRDYFKYVFVPSRKMSQVDEIRYISKTYTKAVEVREEDNTTVVYYYFVKENGEWMVHLPGID